MAAQPKPVALQGIGYAGDAGNPRDGAVCGRAVYCGAICGKTARGKTACRRGVAHQAHLLPHRCRHPGGRILRLRQVLPAGPRQLVARQGRAGPAGKPHVSDGRHLFLHLCRPSLDRQGVAGTDPSDACLPDRRLERRGAADHRSGRADGLPARMASERRAEADGSGRRDLAHRIPGRPDLQCAAAHLHLADHRCLGRLSVPCRAQRAGAAAVAPAAALPVGEFARHLHLRLHHRGLRRPRSAVAHPLLQSAAAGQMDRLRAALSAGHLAQPLWGQGHPRHLHGGLRQ